MVEEGFGEGVEVLIGFEELEFGFGEGGSVEGVGADAGVGPFGREIAEAGAAEAEDFVEGVAVVEFGEGVGFKESFDPVGIGEKEAVGIAFEPGFDEKAGGVGSAGEHLPLVHPVAGGDLQVGILLFRSSEVAGFKIPTVGIELVGGPAVVELVDHLRFVERQEAGAGLVAEQVTVVGHVQHRLESDTPWVFLRLFVAGLADEDGHVAVDFFGEFGIGTGPENRAGAGVGVDEGEFLRCETEETLGLLEVVDAGEVAGELGLVGGSGGEEAELKAAMHSLKNTFPVFEVVEAGEAVLADEVVKIGLGAVVGGNPGGDDKAGAALCAGQGGDGFRKEGVGVDIPGARVGEAPSIGSIHMGVEAEGLGIPFGTDEVLIQSSFKGSTFAERLNQAVAGGFVGGVGNGGAAGGEEFFFLDFNAFPRGISEDAVEAAFGKDLGEAEGPVEDGGLAAEVGGTLQGFGFEGGGIAEAGEEIVVGGTGAGVVGCGLGVEEGGDEEVAGVLQITAGGFTAEGFVGALFGERGFEGLFREGFELAQALKQILLLGLIEVELALSVGKLGDSGGALAVEGVEGAGGFGAVAAEGFEGVGGNAVGELFEIQDAEKSVSDLEVVVEEGKRLAGLVGFDPEGGAGEFNGHGVAVHAVDTVGDDIAEGVAVGFAGNGVPLGPEFGKSFSDAPGGTQKEVSGAAGGVDHLEVEEGLLGLRGVVAEGLGDDRIESGVEEVLDEGVGGVVGAGQPTGVAIGGPFVSETRVAELQGGEVERGNEFKERFIHGAKFLGAHVAVVHGAEASVGGGPAQRAHDFEEFAIGKQGVVEVRALVRGEEASECGESEAGFACGKAPEDNEDALPEVAVSVESGAAEGAFAEAAEAVAFLINFGGAAGGGVVGGWMEESALFDGEEEEKAVDEAEDLLVKLLRSEVAALDGFAEGAVGGVTEKTVAEDDKGMGDTVAESVADAGADVVAFGSPLFPNAGAGFRAAGFPGAGGVEEQPEGAEVGVAFFLEDFFEVEFEVGGPGEGIGVAEEAEAESVADKAPEAGVGGVEELLEDAGGAVAVAVGSAADGVVGGGEVEEMFGGADDKGDMRSGKGIDGKGAFLKDGGGVGGGTAFVAEGLLEEGEEEGCGGFSRGLVLAVAVLLKLFPEGLGNAEGAALLLQQRDAGREMVVGEGLPGALPFRGAVQKRGDKEGAFQVEGVEYELIVGGAAGHG